jgi:uncharacterized protein YoxC
MEIEKSLELLVTAVTSMNKSMDLQFAELRTRMEGLETRMEGLETRMEGLETRMDKVEDNVAKLRMSNEQHIVPSLKVIGENWNDMYHSVQVTREKVEQLEETQNLQGLILEGRIVRAK